MTDLLPGFSIDVARRGRFTWRWVALDEGGFVMHDGTALTQRRAHRAAMSWIRDRATARSPIDE
ncbi:hypothetical protein [Microbacterium paludicola]|uniref:hypothetical protein n=1 Tax=Microbacterium paludicola TaxID=300019 RepID=UPI0011A8D4FB|nr:hypothetical protein [Microbacterium paludicola]